jgi:ElaB/YqjD/DUF883 family membrane-anchored ribosome-binding protein
MLEEQVKDTNLDRKGILKGAINVAEKAAKTAIDVEKMRIAASDIVEDGMYKAKRMMRKGQYAAEDLIEDTAHTIKKDPFRSVGITFGAGLGLGIFAGWLITYRSMKNRI